MPSRGHGFALSSIQKGLNCELQMASKFFHIFQFARIQCPVTINRLPRCAFCRVLC